MLVISIIDYYKHRSLNNQICEAYKTKIKAKVISIGLNPNYPSITIDNNHVYTVPIQKILKDWKHHRNHAFEVGDSIIKEANLNKILIKRGKDYAVYILDCEKWNFWVGIRKTFLGL